MTTMDKDRLAAFVDGELSPEEAAAMVMHLARTPDDQAYVDDLFAANAALAGAFATPLHEPVPERIRAAIMADKRSNVVAFHPRRAVALAAFALAASVAVAAILLPGQMTGPTPGAIALGPVHAGDPVAQVLNARASGDPLVLEDGREAMVLASYALPDGRFCRELEVIDRAASRLDYAVGCLRVDGWSIESAVAEVIASDTGTGFVAAEGATGDPMARFLARAGASLPLDPEAEAQVIARGWTAR
jgi:hypothetical protein